MLASSKEKNRLVPLRMELDRSTNGARRRREGMRKATDVHAEMVSEATAIGIQAKHLLLDSEVCLSRNHEELACQGDAYSLHAHCWPSSKGPTRTPELWGHCFYACCEELQQATIAKHWPLC
jgi:hypothetical protein